MKVNLKHTFHIHLIWMNCKGHKLASVRLNAYLLDRSIMLRAVHRPFKKSLFGHYLHDWKRMRVDGGEGGGVMGRGYSVSIAQKEEAAYRLDVYNQD